jgi:hypothetical protein
VEFSGCARFGGHGVRWFSEEWTATEIVTESNVSGARCNPFQSNYLPEVLGYKQSIREIFAPEFRPYKITRQCAGRKHQRLISAIHAGFVTA